MAELLAGLVMQVLESQLLESTAKQPVQTGADSILPALPHRITSWSPEKGEHAPITRPCSNSTPQAIPWGNSPWPKAEPKPEKGTPVVTRQVFHQLQQTMFVSLPQIRQSSLVYVGAALRVRRFIAQLISGQAVKIGAIGASITAGQGTGGAAGTYPSRLLEWIKSKFPNDGHAVTNGGVPGITSPYMSVCLAAHLPQDLDLVIVEFAANDNHYPDPWLKGPERMGFERLLRKMLNLPKQPALIMLNTYNYKKKQPYGKYWYNAERDFIEYATFYGFPVVSLKAGVYHLLKANMSEGVYQPYNQQAFYGGGRNHPGPFGHQVMSDMLAALLIQIAGEMMLEGTTAKEAMTAASKPVPHPLVPGNYESLRSLCMINEHFRDAVVRTAGFEWLNEARKGAVANKFGYISTQVGSQLDMQVNTTATSSSSKSVGQRVMVQLSYLRSFEHMGMASIECVSGCTCTGVKLDGHHKQPVSLVYQLDLPVTQHPQCVIRATVLPQTKSGEHKVKLMGIMVSEQAGLKEGLVNHVRLSSLSSAGRKLQEGDEHLQAIDETWQDWGSSNLYVDEQGGVFTEPQTFWSSFVAFLQRTFYVFVGRLRVFVL